MKEGTRMYNMFIPIKLEALHEQISFMHVLNLCDILGGMCLKIQQQYHFYFRFRKEGMCEKIIKLSKMSVSILSLLIMQRLEHVSSFNFCLSGLNDQSLYSINILTLNYLKIYQNILIYIKTILLRNLRRGILRRLYVIHLIVICNNITSSNIACC